MVKSWVRPFVPMILLAAFALTGSAQDAKSIVTAAAKAMGAENLRTLQYSGSGSLYDETGQHIVVRSYTQRMDLNAGTSAVEAVRLQGTPPAPQSATQTIGADSPWTTQFEFWLTPYGFLKGAAANNVTSESKTVGGEEYKLVSFTLPGNHKITGYINAKNMVEKVETRIDDVVVQYAYHEYQDFGTLKVPTVMVQMRKGELAMVLIVKEARANA